MVRLRLRLRRLRRRQLWEFLPAPFVLDDEDLLDVVHFTWVQLSSKKKLVPA